MFLVLALQKHFGTLPLCFELARPHEVLSLHLLQQPGSTFSGHRLSLLYVTKMKGNFLFSVTVCSELIFGCIIWPYLEIAFHCTNTIRFDKTWSDNVLPEWLYVSTSKNLLNASIVHFVKDLCRSIWNTVGLHQGQHTAVSALFSRCMKLFNDRLSKPHLSALIGPMGHSFGIVLRLGAYFGNKTPVTISRAWLHFIFKVK